MIAKIFKKHRDELSNLNIFSRSKALDIFDNCKKSVLSFELGEDPKLAISLYQDFKSGLIEELREFVVDKNVPLSKRWDIFIASDLGTHLTYIPDMPELFYSLNPLNVYFIEGCGFERKEMIAYDTILNLHDDCINNGEPPVLKNVDEFKEFMLSNFIKSFNIDW